MTRWLARSMAMLTALLLSLPVGWCCALADCGALPRVEAAAPRKAPCCQQREAESVPRESDQSPPAPLDRCCCAWVATPAQKSNSAEVAPMTADFAVVEVAIAPAAAVDRPLAVVSPFRISPRIHLLQCVWRC